MKKKKKKYIFILGCIVIIGIVAIMIQFVFKERDVFEKYGLDKSNVIELIEKLENNDFPDELSASITEEQVLIYFKEDTYEIDIPENVLYISFAPYLTYTHDCFRHSLTGCQGELVNKDMLIKVYSQNEELIFSRQENTGDDGFIGLFLESNQTYKIEITYENTQVMFMVQSGTSQTCYSELQLQ